MLILKLDEAIRAVCPINGVSVGRWDDRTTWRVNFAEGATDQQKSAVDGVIATFDMVAAMARTTADKVEQDTAKQDATILQLVNSTPAQCVTWARNNFPTLTLAEQNRLGMLISILAVAVRPVIR